MLLLLAHINYDKPCPEHGSGSMALVGHTGSIGIYRFIWGYIEL